MEAADAARALVLSNRIQEIRLALALINAGARITAMTLTTREPVSSRQATSGEAPRHPGVREDGEESSEADEEEGPTDPGETTPPDEVEEEAAERDAGDLTISTEGLEYPPQMMQVIRQQELQLWHAAYDELARLGLTNVPAPPAEIQPLPGELPPEPTGLVAPSARPTPPRQPHRGRGSYRR